MTSQAWIVARREFVERVRTGWFIAVTLLGPALMIGVLVIAVKLTLDDAQETTRVHVQDATGTELGVELTKQLPLAGNFEFTLVPENEAIPELERRIRDEEIDGYLLLPKDLFAGGVALYRGDNSAGQRFNATLRAAVNYAAMNVRGRAVGLSAADLLTLLEPVEVDALQSTGTGEESSGMASFFVGYALMIVLYMAILLYAVNVMRSIVLEKTNRVVEILVSAVKPRALMLGKIVGVAGVGAFQLLVWLVMAAVLIRFREQVLGAFGIPGAGAFDVPPIGLDTVAISLVFFLLGLFFYAALYAAIGAMVNSDQEAQQLQTPIMILLILPMTSVQIVAGNPRGTIAETLTQIPFTSPMLMPMRWTLGGATVVELLVSILTLAACTAGAVWLAARVYRVGILMYGKRPTLRELFRWIRY